MVPQFWRSAKNCPSVHMFWKKDQTVTWGPLPVLQSTEDFEKKWWRNSRCFLMAELWLRHMGSVTTASQSLQHTPGCMWMTELQEAAGACPGDQQSPPTLTPDLSASMSRTETRGSTSRNNCISQILPGAMLHTGFSQECSHSQNKSSHSSGCAGGDLSIPALRAAGRCLPTPFPHQFLIFLLTFNCW